MKLKGPLQTAKCRHCQDTITCRPGLPWGHRATDSIYCAGQMRMVAEPPADAPTPR